MGNMLPSVACITDAVTCHRRSLFQCQQYDDALQWYNYSLSLYSSGDANDANVAKLHRNRAACCIAIQRFKQVSASSKWIFYSWLKFYNYQLWLWCVML